MNWVGKEEWEICDVSCEPFYKCKYFASGVQLLNTLNSNMEE